MLITPKPDTSKRFVPSADELENAKSSLQPIPKKQSLDDFVWSRTSDGEPESYTKACADLGDQLFDVVQNSKKTFVIVPLRGAYPLMMGALARFSDDCEHKGWDVVNKMTVAYLPASVSKNKSMPVFNHKLDALVSGGLKVTQYDVSVPGSYSDVLDNFDDYDEVVIVDEMKSGSALGGLTRIVKNKLGIGPDRKLHVFAMAETPSGETYKQQSNAIRNISSTDDVDFDVGEVGV